MAAPSRREIIQRLAMLGGFPALGRGDVSSSEELPYEDADAYLVYSALIAEPLPGVSPQAEPLVIAAATAASPMCLRPEGEFATTLAPAIANYKEAAAKRWRLQRKFTWPRPYTLIEPQELHSYFRKGGPGWRGFYARYPDSGGYLSLSPVGFNSTREIAVLHADHVCGPLCGGGAFSVLQKKDGQWNYMPWKGSSCSWVS